MSLEKAIEHKKEHREEYRGGKAIDVTCRNNNSCPWCTRNRRINFLKMISTAQDEIKNNFFYSEEE